MLAAGVQSSVPAKISQSPYHYTLALRRSKPSPETEKEIERLEKDILRRKAQLYDMEQVLPKKNGMYLKIILGDVNVSILNKNDKFRYKDEYEKFKLVLSGIGFVLSVCNLFISVRVLELSFMFLLVWYYCTLTIRESILKVNGSRIKGWWRLHHFISTVVAGVLLIWPNTAVWYEFRGQLMWFNVYVSFVQYLQFRYQRGVLYRLKALGERHNMDITIEGFHSWMWRGLSFLLPFLYTVYMFQLYNAYTLYQLSYHPDATWQVSVSTTLTHSTSRATTQTPHGRLVSVQHLHTLPAELPLHNTWQVIVSTTLYQLSYHPDATWQVPFLALMFFVLFLGNIVTTSMVIPQKLHERMKLTYQLGLDRIRKYPTSPVNTHKTVLSEETNAAASSDSDKLNKAE
uniref:Transmembrane protein 120 n=1 Tax=Timema cristinae TaxID=61476 RepID=A0A7R9CNN9_TIMCR|nr:unnamed protein product [Timema cristinae]